MKKILFSIASAITVGIFLLLAGNAVVAEKDVHPKCKDGSNNEAADKATQSAQGFSDLVLEKCAYCHSLECTVLYKDKIDSWPKKVKNQLKKSGGPDYSSSDRKKIAKELKNWAGG